MTRSSGSGLSSGLGSTQLLRGERSGSDGFQEQKTEAPVELTLYMFTYLLLSYIQYYLQHIHIMASYMLCLITFNLSLKSHLSN